MQIQDFPSKSENIYLCRLIPSLNVIHFGFTIFFFPQILTFGVRANLQFLHTLKYKVPDIKETSYEKEIFSKSLHFGDKNVSLVIISLNTNKTQRVLNL